MILFRKIVTKRLMVEDNKIIAVQNRRSLNFINDQHNLKVLFTIYLPSSSLLYLVVVELDKKEEDIELGRRVRKLRKI
jgi:pantothenate kinase